MYPAGTDQALVDSMLILAFFTVMAMKGYHAAWISSRHNPDPIWKEYTQRSRYLILAVVQTAVAVPVLWGFTRGDIGDFWASIETWWGVAGPIGYVIAVMAAGAIATPLLSVLTWQHIYRFPATIAKRAGKDPVVGPLYYKTADWRARKSRPLRKVYVYAEVDEHRGRHRHKQYVYVI